MHINGMTPYAKSYSTQNSTINTVTPNQAVPATPKDELEQYRDILSNYNMTNISPKEIDTLFDELKQAGHPITEDMMFLSTRGAKWRQHLAEIGAELNNQQVTFDPNQKIDLFAEIKSNIEFNKQHGYDSQHFESLLNFVSKLDGSKTLSSHGLTA